MHPTYRFSTASCRHAVCRRYVAGEPVIARLPEAPPRPIRRRVMSPPGCRYDVTQNLRAWCVLVGDHLGTAGPEGATLVLIPAASTRRTTCPMTKYRGPPQ